MPVTAPKDAGKMGASLGAPPPGLFGIARQPSAEAKKGRNNKWYFFGLDVEASEPLPPPQDSAVSEIVICKNNREWFELRRERDALLRAKLQATRRHRHHHRRHHRAPTPLHPSPPRRSGASRGTSSTRRRSSRY